jgi:hypothetical protein
MRMTSVSAATVRRSAHAGPGAGSVERAPVPLLVAGLVLLAVYLAATVRLALPRYFPGPGVTVGFAQMLGPDRAWVSFLYIAMAVLTFAWYGVAVATVWRHRDAVSSAVLVAFAVLFILVLAFMYPPTAMDVIHYHADARTFWVFGDNPLVVPPSAHPYPVGMSWADRPSAYGPFWSLLTGLVVLPTGDHFLAGLIGLKLLAGAFGLGCAWLVYRLAAQLRPGWERVALVLFLWNPFVLHRVAAGGHNDIVMAFFALLALERAQRRAWPAAFAALTLSVLVKYVSALLAPPLVLYAWWHAGSDARARLRALAPAVGVAALLTVLVYAPFWQGWETFATLREQLGSAQFLITSMPLLVQYRLLPLMPPEEAATMARVITTAVYLVLYLPLIWQARRDPVRLVTAGATVLFLYAVVAAGWFRPWYMLWTLPLMAALPGTWFTPLLLAVSFFANLPDLVEQYGMHWRWLAADSWRAVSAPVVLTFWPPLLVWYFGLLRFASWHFDVPRPGRPELETPA